MPNRSSTAAKPSQQPANATGEASAYWESRARREAAEAELAELKVEEQRGRLVDAAGVRAALGGRLSALRESLLQLPARLSAVLAAESDQDRCHEALMAEIQTVLQQAADIDREPAARRQLLVSNSPLRRF